MLRAGCGNDRKQMYVANLEHAECLTTMQGLITGEGHTAEHHHKQLGNGFWIGGGVGHRLLHS